MNKNNKINIVKSLVKNKRIFGAAVILSSSKSANYLEVLQLSTLFEICLQSLIEQGDQPALLAKSRMEKDFDKFKLGSERQGYETHLTNEEKLYIWHDFVKWAPKLSSENFDKYISLVQLVHQRNDESLVCKILTNSTTVQTMSSSVTQTLENMIDELPVPKLREFDQLFQKTYCFPLRALILKAIIQKAQIVYWEYYNLGQIMGRFGNHAEALENYKHFYAKALEQNQTNVIQTAISEALKSVLYVDNVEEFAEYFVRQCPQDVMENSDLIKIKIEVDSVINSRAIFNNCKTLFSNEIGYQYFDLSTLNLMYKNSLDMVSVHPSHTLFYHLFKICSVLNKSAEAKHWLKESFNTNVLMFTIGI